MLKLLLILAPVLYFAYKQLLAFRVNLAAAKASGIPYITSPIYCFNRIWLITLAIWSPLMRLVPRSIQPYWMQVLDKDWVWKTSYSIFQQLETDTFLVVSPGKILMIVADADVIVQLTTRRNDFPKPVWMYRVLDVYGKNVVTLEGKEWRRHRKITAPQFGEQNNRVVFTESIFQAGQMLKSWTILSGKISAQEKVELSPGSKAEKSDEPSTARLCTEVAKDAMRLSLHVISRAGFDVRCLWPGLPKSEEDAADEDAMQSGVVPKGHTMSYTTSLETLLHRMLVILLFPSWALERIPFKFVQTAREAFHEWGKYMQEIYDAKSTAITEDLNGTNSVQSTQGLDLMGAMIRGSGQIPGTANHGKVETAGLTPSEVMGNSFVLFLAGHETAANVIHFALVYLAMHPAIQRKLQAELDTIFGDREPEDWDYDRDLPKLFDGLTGAVMNETLRLIPPVIGIPKSTEAAQHLEVNGKDCIVPGNADIIMNAAALHRNPKYWPNGLARAKEFGGPFNAAVNPDNDLDEFKPERWLLSTEMTRNFKANGAAKGRKRNDVDKPSDDLAVNMNPDTATTMYTYPKGAYIPFSAGFRACSGRRFAQVEILAALATIFRRHSIELDVSEIVSGGEAELQEMSDEMRRGVFLKMRRKVEDKMVREMGTIITIQLRGKPVHLRLCERGSEVFDLKL